MRRALDAFPSPPAAAFEQVGWTREVAEDWAAGRASLADVRQHTSGAERFALLRTLAPVRGADPLWPVLLRLADALVGEERHRQGPFGPTRILPNGQPVTYAEMYDLERYDAANRRAGGRA